MNKENIMNDTYPLFLIRLTSGEEILAQVTNMNDSDPTLNIINPVLMVHTGEGKMGFMSWMPYMDQSNGVNIPFTSLLFEPAPVIAAFEKAYNDHMNKEASALQMPEQPKLVL